MEERKVFPDLGVMLIEHVNAKYPNCVGAIMCRYST